MSTRYPRERIGGLALPFHSKGAWLLGALGLSMLAWGGLLAALGLG